MKIKFGRLSAVLVIAAVLPGLVLLAAGSTFARSLHKGEWIQPQGYPVGFHGWGRLDRINADSVIIDDTQYRLTSSASYHTPDIRNAPVSEFSKGDLIGFMQNAEDEIVSLWRID